MVRIRTGGLVAVLAFGLLGAGACKKNKSGASGSSAAASDLSLLPADSEMVLSINVAQIRNSALWKDVGKQLTDKANDDEKLKELKTACGVDPVADITSVAIGMKGFSGDNPDGVIIVHGLSKAKLTSDTCFNKLKAEAEKDGSTITKDGDVYLNKGKEPSDNAAAMFVGDDTLLITGGTIGTKDGITAIAKGNNGLKSSSAFTDVYKNVDANGSMWLVINGNSALFDKAAALGAKPKAVWGTLKVADGVSFDGGARFASADDAKKLADLVNQQINNPMIKGMVDKLEVKADGTDLKGTLEMSRAKLDALKAQLGAMFGGMGGMGGE